MKRNFLTATLSVFLLTIFLFSCESRPTEKAAQPTPQVFTPEKDTVSTESRSDATVNSQTSENTELGETEVKRKPMPTVEELKKITPSQEAKRALSNDAMQIYRMQPEAFYKFLQGRIPYYRGKGHLKAENDLVRIEITEQQMLIETPEGRQTFPMQ